VWIDGGREKGKCCTYLFIKNEQFILTLILSEVNKFLCIFPGGQLFHTRTRLWSLIGK
jgi:hypothetical protein